MALNAVHIRARSSSPVAVSGDRSHDYDRTRYHEEGSDPFVSSSRRGGIGSSSGTEESYHWTTLRTGESLGSSALRMRHRFVRATALSDPNLRNQATEFTSDVSGHGSTTSPSDSIINLDRTNTVASSGTMSVLYASLAREIQPQPQAEQAAPAMSLLEASGRREKETHRTHHHRHDIVNRRKSDWFVSKALVKLQHRKHLEQNKRKQDRGDEVTMSVLSGKEVKLCPTCGDPLPTNASPDDMALHRQSITHRLGLNAPVSSASASEAPSPAASATSTPISVSRQASPEAASGPSGSSQRRSPTRRRLSTAPRWKKIHHDNVGYNLLSRMGWKEGMGLGVEEWKWQQFTKEKKRQKLEGIRAMLRRATTSDGSSFADPIRVSDYPEDNVTLFPSAADTQEPSMQELLGASSTMLPDAYQFGDEPTTFLDGISSMFASYNLTAQEQQALQEAVTLGQVRPEDLRDAFGLQFENLNRPQSLIDPIEVDLKADRKGLGSNSRRRSRASDGTVEIRRQQPAEPAEDDHLKKAKTASSKSNQYLRPNSKLTKHQRKLVEERKKREWLDLRASLS